MARKESWKAVLGCRGPFTAPSSGSLGAERSWVREEVEPRESVSG